jgi:hypothetical protein
MAVVTSLRMAVSPSLMGPWALRCDQSHLMGVSRQRARTPVTLVTPNNRPPEDSGSIAGVAAQRHGRFTFNTGSTGARPKRPSRVRLRKPRIEQFLTASHRNQPCFAPSRLAGRALDKANLLQALAECPHEGFLSLRVPTCSLRNAATVRAGAASAAPGLINPTTGIAGCCACAASGQSAAAPPRSVMNSRRLIRSPRRRGRARRTGR